jgi:hypothetical protein
MAAVSVISTIKVDRENHDQRRLPKIGGLSAHVGPGQDEDGVGRRVQIKVVGDKTLALRSHEFLLLDHRMPPADDFNVRRVVELRPAVIAQCGIVGEGRQHIHFGQCQRGLPDSPRLPSNGRAQFGKHAPLDLDDLLLGIEDFGLIFLEFRRGEALGVDQCLPPLIIRRHQVQVDPGDFEVVAEYRIEPDLE